MLRIYNTLSRKIEEFRPLNPPTVTYYSCGPTVYDYAHIGHARTYVFTDILERVLIFSGYSVKRVMNITDVGHLTSDADTGEDKMEKGAKREGKSVWDLAKFYTQDFFEMSKKLNIIKPQIVCKATDHIKEMIGLVKLLEKKGFTYNIDDGVYFDTSKLSKYGKLTGQTFEELINTLRDGARVEPVKGKKNITDFALWKFTPKGVKRQMEWDSPWGSGFPGWHIECSAMSMKYLGKTLDIHTGGADHIRIHHTNEIAQSEAATSKPFAKNWLHASHLLVDGEKMSKSLGNFLRLIDIENKGYNPLSLRYLFLTSHYRKEMNFTFESLDGAQNAMNNLKNLVSTIKIQTKKAKRANLSSEKMRKIDTFRSEFIEAIENDLNTPQALSVLWRLVKSNIPPADKHDLVFLFDKVLGLKLDKIKATSPANVEIPKEVTELVKQREEFRKNKKWTEADKLRNKIKRKGYLVDDSPTGSVLKSLKRR